MLVGPSVHIALFTMPNRNGGKIKRMMNKKQDLPCERDRALSAFFDQFTFQVRT